MIDDLTTEWHTRFKRKPMKYTLGRPDFWRICQSPFYGFLEVCMSGPEEDLAQGGRFLMWPEHFINLFNIDFFQINF